MMFKNFTAMSLLLSVIATPSFAQLLEVTSNTSRSEDATQLNVLVPLQQNDTNRLSAVAGYGSSSTRLHNLSDLSQDAKAQYVNVGLEGRTFIPDMKKVSAFVRATYNARTGGSTIHSKYSQDTGRLYNPMGGGNLGVGVSTEFVRGAAITLQLNKSLSGDRKSSVFLGLDVALGRGASLAD